METLVALIVGLFGGGALGTAFGHWLNRPAAAARVEETRRLLDRRVELVTMGRALVREARDGNWSYGQTALDGRFIELRRHLSNEVQEMYVAASDGDLSGSIPLAEFIRPSAVGMPTQLWNHSKLQADVDRLNEAWKLS